MLIPIGIFRRLIDHMLLEEMHPSFCVAHGENFATEDASKLVGALPE